MCHEFKHFRTSLPNLFEKAKIQPTLNLHIIYVSTVNWILLTVFVLFLKYQSMNLQQPIVSKRKYYIAFMTKKE